MIIVDNEATNKVSDMRAARPMLQHLIRASLAFAIIIAATDSVFAGRQVRGDDVAKLLTGKQFQIECVDGTVGRGQINQYGLASVSYRRPSMPPRKPDEYDNAMIRVRGVEICLAWRRFGGGGDGCYPVSEEAAGRYRLSTGPLWCDISPK